MDRKKGPVWDEGVAAPSFPALTSAEVADVCVIGGGLCGVLTTYHLAKAGKNVVLLEKDQLGHGATGLTTAFVTETYDTDYADLISILGKQRAARVIGAHRSAIRDIQRIAKDEGIECEGERTSAYLYATTEDEAKSLQEERDAASALGCEIEYHAPTSLPFKHTAALEIKDQFKFHPLKFLYGVAGAAQGGGARIFEHSEARLEDGRITTPRGSVTARHVIAATYSPLEEPLSLFFKKGMYVTYILELRMPAGSLPAAMFEDMQNPYHYFRVDQKEGYDRIILGGEDHRQDIPVDESKNYQALEEFARTTFASLPFEIVRQWKGPILEPVDGLAFVGANGDERVQYAFGFSGSGMTYSAVASHILADAVLGKPNESHELFDAARVPGGKALAIKGRDYVEELVHGAAKNALTYRKRDH